MSQSILQIQKLDWSCLAILAEPNSFSMISGIVEAINLNGIYGETWIGGRKLEGEDEFRWMRAQNNRSIHTANWALEFPKMSKILNSIYSHFTNSMYCNWQILTRVAASMWLPTMDYLEMKTVEKIKILSVRWKEDKTFPQQQLQFPILQQQQHQLQQLHRLLGLTVTVERCREVRGSLVELIPRRMSTLGRWEFETPSNISYMCWLN